MGFFVYILYSQKLLKHYIGQTSDLNARLERHNQGRNPFTKKGLPWELIYFRECEKRAEAMRLEKQIKNLGTKRFLESLGLR
jgi:putative endonuclease